MLERFDYLVEIYLGQVPWPRGPAEKRTTDGANVVHIDEVRTRKRRLALAGNEEEKWRSTKRSFRSS